MEKVRLMIACKITGNLESQIILLNRFAKKLAETDYTISRVGPYVHVTIFFGEFNIIDEDLIFKKMQQIAENFKKFSIKLTGNIVADAGYIFLRIEKSRQLFKLHNEVLKQINSLCIGSRPPYFGNQYNPHISIVKFDKFDVAEKVKNAIEMKLSSMEIEKSLTVEKISICKLITHAQCSDTLKSFSLL